MVGIRRLTRNGIPDQYLEYEDSRGQLLRPLSVSGFREKGREKH